MKVIGKEFDTKTIQLKKLLDFYKLQYEFCDMEFDEAICEWMKLEKIMGIPVLCIKDTFTVGFSESSIVNYLEEFKLI